MVSLSSSWSKFTNLYCDSYAYRGNKHFAFNSLEEALQSCVDDASCAAMAQWGCDADTSYNYCGVSGYNLRNYNAANECTIEKPAAKAYTTHASTHCGSSAYLNSTEAFCTTAANCARRARTPPDAPCLA